MEALGGSAVFAATLRAEVGRGQIRLAHFGSRHNRSKLAALTALNSFDVVCYYTVEE